MVCCIYARRHNTQYQTIQHACGPWLLQRFSSPYRRSLHKEKTVCAACDQVNKYKSHPKQTMKHNQKRLCMFQGNCDFSCAFFLFDWMVEDFLQILPHPLGSRRAEVQVTSIVGHAASLFQFGVSVVIRWCLGGVWVMCWWSVSIAQVRLGGVWASMHA